MRDSVYILIEWLDSKLQETDEELTETEHEKEIEPGININSYLSHRIRDSFPRILKWKVKILKPVLLDTRG